MSVVPLSSHMKFSAVKFYPSYVNSYPFAKLKKRKSFEKYVNNRLAPSGMCRCELCIPVSPESRD